MRTNKCYNLIDNVKYMIQLQCEIERKSLILQCLSIPLETFISLVSVYMLKNVLNIIENEKGISNLLFIVVLFTAVLCILNILKTNFERFILQSKWRLNNCLLRKKLDEKIMDMDYEIFTSPKGKILHGKADSAIVGENGQSVSDFLNLIIVLFSSFSGFIAYVVILAKLNWVIILLLVASYVIDALIGLATEKWLQGTKTDRSAIRKKLIYIGHSTRSVDIAKDIRLYNMTPWLKTMGEIFTKQDNEWTNKVQMNYFKTYVFEAVLVLIKTGAAYSYLIFKMLENNSKMNIGDFCLYFVAITQFGNWLSKIVNAFEKIINSSYEVSNFREFIDQKDVTNRKKGKIIPKIGFPASIKLENVSYVYPESNVKALDNVNLLIEEGESIAIVGMNGSGKTTLVKIICGLIRPTSGQVYINDVEINDYNRDDYYKLFTAIFQDFCVLPMSISKNITLSDDTAINKDSYNDALELSGFFEKVQELPEKSNTKLLKNIMPGATELSGGELQKLLLAKAIYKKSSIMILDEPTAALDPLSEEEIYKKYNKIANEKTTLFISHRLSSTKFCDRILFIDNGKIIEQGTHAELILENGKYAEMFNTQSYYYQKELQKKVAEL